MPELAAGRVLGAFALTESGSGSDAGSLRTAATPDGDGWTITGSKQWITNGSHAGTFLVFARTDAAVDGPARRERVRASTAPTSRSRARRRSSA